MATEKKRIVENMAVWQSRQNQFRYETHDFDLPLHDLSRDDLRTLMRVTEADIEWSVFALNVVKPAQATKLRRVITYLTELMERQNEAWDQHEKDLEQETKRINAPVYEHTI